MTSIVIVVIIITSSSIVVVIVIVMVMVLVVVIAVSVMWVCDPSRVPIWNTAPKTSLHPKVSSTVFLWTLRGSRLGQMWPWVALGDAEDFLW